MIELDKVRSNFPSLSLKDENENQNETIYSLFNKSYLSNNIYDVIEYDKINYNFDTKFYKITMYGNKKVKGKLIK